MKKKNSLISFCFFAGFLISGSFLYAKDFKGAEYRTKDSFLYGRFEVRMKSAEKDAVLSTFFTYFDGLPDDPWTLTKWNEIDLEIIGRYSHDVQFNTITAGQVSHVSHIWTDFNPADDYHVYAFEWTPEKVDWFVDGELVRTQTADHILTITRAQKIMMNTWIPQYSNWVGEWNSDVLPAFTYFDYVSYSSYTPGNGNDGTKNDFSFQWKDDFDSLNLNIWERASHTFSGNLCDFVPENIVAKDGKLILCLTDKVNTGFTDVFGPKVIYTRQTDTTIFVKLNEFVDKTSAEKTSNYLFSNLKVKSAKVTDDQTVVCLTTEKMDTSISYRLITQKIGDQFTPVNYASITSQFVTKAKPLSFPLKIDVGSSVQYSDYLPDQNISFDKMYGHYDGEDKISADSISSTNNDFIYQTDNRGLCEYQVRVPNGTYKVTLQFSENEYAESEARIFDITVEKSTNKKTLIDIAKEAGKSAAFDLEFNSVKVEDGELDIHFSSVFGLPSLSGLVIDQLSLSTSINAESTSSPIQFQLNQNYPNPFNGDTIIEFRLSKPQNIKFEIYDLTGRKIYQNNLGYLKVDKHQIKWDGRNNSGNMLSSGTYIFSLFGEKSVESKKLTLLK